MTAVRPAWNELPADLRHALAARLDGITAAEVQRGGFTPGLAARLVTGDGRVFAKGIPADHVLADKYRTEAEVTRRLPTSVPAPRQRWSGELAGWVVLVFDDMAGRTADLSPGSPDTADVMDTVDGLAKILTPAPIEDLPKAVIELAELLHGWRELADDGVDDLDAWTLDHLAELAELETQWVMAAEGDTLLHGDLTSPGNILVGNDESVSIVDWAQPLIGAAWIDVVDLVPQLILAGHEPAAADEAVAGTRAWRSVDDEVITSYAAAFAGYWARMSRKPAPPGVPNVRAYQARGCQAACRWVAHRRRERA